MFFIVKTKITKYYADFRQNLYFVLIANIIIKNIKSYT